MKAEGGRTRVLLFLLATGCWSLVTSATADTHYVDINSVSPSPPFTNWVTAATNIQDAIDVSLAGDTVLVTNGVYNTGGRLVYYLLTNRVAITTAVTVASVNGPAVTVIEGRAHPNYHTNGDSAVRCVYMTDGAALFGFTLSNGHTRLSGDALKEGAGGGVWCETTNAAISNCVFVGNTAARFGGGVKGGTLHNCLLRDNGAWTASAMWDENGGGACSSLLYNCVLKGNHAVSYGGGAYKSTLRGCTVVRNRAGSRGGGASGCTLANSIVYYNIRNSGTESNHDNCTMTYSCTAPGLAGAGNISNAPIIACLDNPRLLEGSPCIGAGTNMSWLSGQMDMDLEPRTNGVVDMGADEYWPAGLTGSLAVALSATETQVAPGYAIGFECSIDGRVQGYAWDFGDGYRLTNFFSTAHSFAATGVYPVVLTASNADGSTSATLDVRIVQTDLYVSPAGSNMAPFESWANAATTIQAAVDAASPGCVVWVTNGTYNTGGRVVNGAMTNRVAVYRPVTVRSVNGPEETSIVGAANPTGTNGDAAVRCVYLTDGAAIAGFTLTNGHTRFWTATDPETSGGGVYAPSKSAVLSNCLVTGCTADGDGGGVSGATAFNTVIRGNCADVYGGGAFGADLYHCVVLENVAIWGGGIEGCAARNCVIRGNTAGSEGGGAAFGSAYWCTIVGNTAVDEGGGTYLTTLGNCIVSYNEAAASPDIYRGGTVYGCITNAPRIASVENPRLLASSPCINVGTNTVDLSWPADIEGEPRTNGIPDVGADECWPAGLTGELTAVISPSVATTGPGGTLEFEAHVDGAPQGYAWDFGDGGAETDLCVAAHLFAETGTYTVVLSVSNLDHTVAATSTVSVLVMDFFASTNGDDAAAGTNWATAKRTIQAAVDSAFPAGTVWVSNGIYSTGARALSDGCTNRVAVDKALTLRSANGPADTMIVGTSRVRGVYLADGASLIGFTIKDAQTDGDGTPTARTLGGGVYCESGSPIVSNCVITNCSAVYHGGGIYRGRAWDCVITDCRGLDAAGAYQSELHDCILRGGVVKYYGGGASEASLYGCVVVGNLASNDGGGVYDSIVQSCTIVGNTALNKGGGAYGCGITNSIVWMNYGPTNENWYGCTMAFSSTEPMPTGPGNRTGNPGIASPLNPRLLPGSPCIDAGTNVPWLVGTLDIDHEARLNGAPDIGADEHWPLGLTGDLSGAVSVSWTQVAPGFEIPFTFETEGKVQGYVVSAGDGTRVTNTFALAHAFTNPGLYQVTLTLSNLSGAVTVTVAVQVADSQIFVAPGGSNAWAGTNWVTAKATIQAGVDAAFAGGHVWVTDGVYRTDGRIAHALPTNRVVLGKPVTVQSVNGPLETFIEGRFDPATTNTGRAAIRCVWMTNGATLAGFTLTNGYTLSSGSDDRTKHGGGAYCLSSSAVLSNCIISDCVANYHGGGAYGGTLRGCLLERNTASWGGGAYQSVLQNSEIRRNRARNYGGGLLSGSASACVISDNIASDEGGGAYGANLQNCLLHGNWATNGGGARACTSLNCTMVSNTAVLYGGGVYRGTTIGSIICNNRGLYSDNWEDAAISYTCTRPMPTGDGNITNDPRFVNEAVGNFRLMPASPCLNAGVNQGWMEDERDLDGNMRVFGGTVDMGAYEFVIRTEVRALLQGPHDGAGSMTTFLSDSNMLPLTSPYASDIRSVDEPAPMSTDWVLLGLLTTNFEVQAERSVFIRQNGMLQDPDGVFGSVLDVAIGDSYYITVKHRNHVAIMSANPVSYTNATVSYDFRTNSVQYCGGTNAAVELETGYWGMIAGDADGDGEVTPTDRSICEQQRGRNGYLSGDFNLDGVVNGSD